MRLALAQIDSHLGAFKKNAEKILHFIKDAKERRCDIVVFPELSLFGYRPSDLLERKDIVNEQSKYIAFIKKNMPADIIAIFGLVVPNKNRRGKPYYNSAIVLNKKDKPKYFYKQLLPTYDVFDEYRHLEHGDVSKNFLTIKSKKILITICEDIWAWDLPKMRNPYPENPLLKLKNKKVDLVINLSASPFAINKEKLRFGVTKKTANLFKAPMVYVNMVGAQDELIFDGGSFAIDKTGKLIAQCVHFSEDLNIIDFAKQVGGFRQQKLSEPETLRQALVLGIRDFVQKTGFSQVHLGLSGGIDSAVVACLAVDALGPAKVHTFALPGPFSAPESLSLAQRLAKNIHVELTTIEINSTYIATLAELEKSFSDLKFGTVQENIQARLRGLFLMSYANYKDSLLLTTGNKSEYATGYCTLYGDMCGGLAPIADLVKAQVYDLANHYNSQQEIIPREVIDRAPSAELRPNQKDQDTLPAYPDLDKAVAKIVQNKLTPKSETEKWLLKMLMRSEFKRWQAAPILRVTEHAFGRGRNFPIAHKAVY